MDNTSDVVSEREDDSGIESSAPDPTDNNVYIRIAVTDLKIQKCLQFRQDELVWSAKETVLANMAKDLKDGLNYGFYCPPQNGKAGKFLDEERPLCDYPLPGPIGFLEFKYKRRVYKVMQINPKKLRQLHTKANLKQFVESVRTGNIEKITKFTNRGLDPNFHDHDSGETPLLLSTALEKPRDVIIALVSGGAHIDFRNKAGMTAMHQAALHGNTEAIKTLLDLGASPNYKDTRGLTPLYHCIVNDTNALCTEILLHDHSLLGVSDERGWQEIHQACKLGKVQHLEHLIFYGTEMNVQNSSGNTPLHVAAVNNQESCARVLLFRGADKTIQNFANQDAFQVAVIAGNCELADVIKGFKSDEVVPFQEVPKYNEQRRSTAPLTLHKLQRSRSDPRLNLSFSPAPQQNGHPSSPCLSNSSLPHYVSNGHINMYESLSSGNHSATLQRKHYDSDSPRSMSISSSGSASAFSVYGYANYGRRSSVQSDTFLFTSNKKRLYPAMPGRSFIAVKNHKASDESELNLRKGQFVEVISVGEGGYWEGRVKDAEGWFPSSCVQEVDMRRRGSIPGPRIEDETVMINRRTLAALAASDGDNSPKTVVLQRGGNGFGFVLRGAKAQTSAGSSLDFTPTSDFPALQYLDRVDKHSPADRAGLKPGDFLLEINGEVVVNATHEHTVNLIKYSGDTLAMKVITVKPLSSEGLERDIHADGTRTLPIKKKEKLDVNLAQFDEVDYDSAAVRRGVDVNNKTASIRARQAHARLTAYEIEDMMTRQGMTQVDVHHSASSQNKPMIPVLPKTYNSVADMKKKNGNGTLSKNHRARSTPNLAQDEEMQIYQNSDLASRRHVANIDLDQGQPVYSRQISTPDTSTLGRRVANGSPAMQREQMYAVPNTPQRHYRSVENVLEATVPAGGKYIIPPHPHEPAPTPPRPRSGIPPPPDHPPPIPPHDRTQTEVVKITKSPTYANVSAQIQQQKRSESDYESSFRPGIGARLNKEPIVPESVGLRKLAHSRSSSNVSSGSDHSGDQKPLNVRGTVEIFEQNSGQTTPSRKESVSFAEDKVVENAAKFVKEHPGANVLYTADQKRHNGGHIYEPEPDYDDTDQTLSHIPEVRSLRETWQTSGQKNRHVPVTPPSSRSVHNVTQSSYISESQPKNQRSSFAAQPRKPTTQTPRTPDQEDSSNMSAFSSAIKQAAIAREQKKNSPTAQPPPPPPAQVNRQNVSQTSRSQAAPNAPPPPPPPPPPSTTEPRVSPQTVRNGTPPQVRPQMEEKRRNDPHAALMAAIAKRRGMVDKVNGDTLADSIEDKIQKNKKPVSNGNKPSSTTIDLKPSPKSQAPIPPNDLPKPNPAPVTPTSNTSSPSPSDEPQNFRAMAERRRQEYLQKKAAGTLDRRKGSPSPHSRSSPKSPDDEEKENEPQKAKPLNQCSPSPAVSQQTNNSNNSGNGTGLGDIASVIAQRAMQRQKSTSGIVDSNGNKANEKASHSTVYKSPVANNNGGSRQRGDGDKGMEVKGATVDFSHTESPRDERLSVFARAKMFESSKNQSKSSVTNGASLPFDLPPPVIETNGTYLVDDIPPPMITPPPPEFDYSHSPDLGIVSNGHTQNGLETVGWVINSSPPRYSQEYAIRNKTATMNSYSVSPSHRETLVDDIQVDFIPPPPLFDGDLGPEPPLHTGNKVVAEDAASMVSSLSTLSTVSSSEHESYQHDSSGYSSSRNRFTPLHTSSAQSEEVFLEVAPPPPGFDDGGEDFIPPPMGFGIPGPDDRQPVNNLRHNLRNTGRASQGYHSKAVEEWTTQDICDWLDSINLGHLAIHFIRAGLQGDQLTHMGSQDYLMLGITSPDHRMSVERAVRRVQLNR